MSNDKKAPTPAQTTEKCPTCESTERGLRMCGARREAGYEPHLPTDRSCKPCIDPWHLEAAASGPQNAMSAREFFRRYRAEHDLPLTDPGWRTETILTVMNAFAAESRLYGVGPGDVNAWSIEGKHYTIGSHSNDLFMAPEKKEGWINIYKDVYAPNGVSVSKVYNTEAEAKSVWVSALAICKITWEE